MSMQEFLAQRANEMRQEPTKAERRLYRLLGSSEWETQVPLLNRYIADFLHRGYGLVLEADGGYHYEGNQPLKDQERDRAMHATGFQVLRFTNRDIFKRGSWVLECVETRINAIRIMRGDAPAKRRKAIDWHASDRRMIPLKLSDHRSIKADSGEDDA